MNDIYSFYSTYCQFIKRRLCSPEDLHDWYLKIDRFFFIDKGDFIIFLDYLDDKGLISPLIKTNEFSELFQSQIIKQSSYNEEELIAYYHPLQFIQILTFIEHLNRRNSMFELNYWCDPDFLYYYWVKGKNISLENKRIANLVSKFPKIEKGNLIKKLNQVMWLKPEYLKLWIKLESIWLCVLFASIDINLIWDGFAESSRSKIYKKLDSHQEWARREIEKFSEKDLNKIKEFDKVISHIPRIIKNFPEMNDLSYLFTYRKKDQLTSLCLYFNILEISRELKRIHWILAKVNTMEKPVRPPFVFEKNQEKEIREFYDNVLLDYGLFPREPFTVFVEGGTEYEILTEYKKRRAGFEYLGFINLMGIGKGKLKATIPIIKNHFKDRLSYLLLDYETSQHYENIKIILEKHKFNLKEDVHFFIPDFVSENFTVDQVFNSYLKWLNIKNLVLKNEEKKDLLSQLTEAKKRGQQLKNDLYKNITKDIRLEHILINNTLRIFNKELVNLYPKLNTYSRDGQKKFSHIFKQEFCPFLTDIVIEWFKKEKREDFYFETALGPFYMRTSEYRFELNKKKFNYSSLKFFY